MEAMFIGILILALSISVVIMANRNKHSVVNVSQGIDIEKLAKHIATEVGKEMAKAVASELRDILYSVPQKSESRSKVSIEIDESIIPVDLNVTPIKSNTENMVKKETKVDKDLSKSKDKLKTLLGKKKE